MTRIVVLGASGFLGRSLMATFSARRMTAIGIGSRELDLTTPDAGARLAEILKPGDRVVFLAALTPDRGRDFAAFRRNMAMGDAVSIALAQVPPAHLVYLSSDAVYSFREALVRADASPDPGDLYGVMHRAREILLAQAARCPIAILRATMLYGPGDPHNSYGPNSFRRAAAKDGRIVLGGNGEETRDYVLVEDAARLVADIIDRQAACTLNVATGRSISAAALAAKVAARFSRPVEIVTTARARPVTHRHFDMSAFRHLLPAFRWTPLDAGLDLAQRDVASPN